MPQRDGGRAGERMMVLIASEALFSRFSSACAVSVTLLVVDPGPRRRTARETRGERAEQSRQLRPKP
jgi:hypothetical protein